MIFIRFYLKKHRIHWNRAWNTSSWCRSNEIIDTPLPMISSALNRIFFSDNLFWLQHIGIRLICKKCWISFCKSLDIKLFHPSNLPDPNIFLVLKILFEEERKTSNWITRWNGLSAREPTQGGLASEHKKLQKLSDLNHLTDFGELFIKIVRFNLSFLNKIRKKTYAIDFIFIFGLEAHALDMLGLVTTIFKKNSTSYAIQPNHRSLLAQTDKYQRTECNPARSDFWRKNEIRKLIESYANICNRIKIGQMINFSIFFINLRKSYIFRLNELLRSARPDLSSE